MTNCHKYYRTNGRKYRKERIKIQIAYMTKQSNEKIQSFKQYTLANTYALHRI